MDDKKRICELEIDEFIWGAFIILSFFNICGDECEKGYCIEHDLKKKKYSKYIFIFTLSSSLFIYLYLEYYRYSKLNYAKIKKQNIAIWEIRCFGGILVVIATLLFLYCQIVEPDPENPLIV